MLAQRGFRPDESYFIDLAIVALAILPRFTRARACVCVCVRGYAVSAPRFVAPFISAELPLLADMSMRSFGPILTTIYCASAHTIELFQFTLAFRAIVAA